MAITVKHRHTGKYYIFLGASYSYFKDSRPSFLGGNLLPHEEEGTFMMASVTDKNGTIHFFPSKELKIIEIDGIKPDEVLSRLEDEENRGNSNFDVSV